MKKGRTKEDIKIEYKSINVIELKKMNEIRMKTKTVKVIIYLMKE